MELFVVRRLKAKRVFMNAFEVVTLRSTGPLVTGHIQSSFCFCCLIFLAFPVLVLHLPGTGPLI